MDEEEKKEQGAVKQGLDNASNKGKEIAKEKAKNEVKKGIFNSLCFLSIQCQRPFYLLF